MTDDIGIPFLILSVLSLLILLLTMRSKLTFLPLFSISVLLLSVSSGWAAGQVEDFRVGLILDSGSTLGRIILTSVNMSLFDFYNKHPNSKRRLQITLRNSDNDVVNAASAGNFPYPRYPQFLSPKHIQLKLEFVKYC